MNSERGESGQREAGEALFQFTVQCSLVAGDPLKREGIIPAKADNLNDRIMNRLSAVPDRKP